MSFSVDEIKNHVPYYLTKEAKEGLLAALKDFPQKINYYTSRYPDEVLQGDGWNGLDVINFETAQKKPIRGIVLSNTCDISKDNPRDFPAKIVFAPLIPLWIYENRLASSSIAAEKVAAKIDAIKQQKITSIFYLPKGGALESDHIALLDDLHTVPSGSFHEKTSKEKFFTLSQAGFYLFIFKLSIHFCRFHENLPRDAA